MSTYTIRPTYSDRTIKGPLRDDFRMVGTPNLEAEIRAILRDSNPDSDGAHVFEGANGPLYDLEGRDENYCGWVPVNPEAISVQPLRYAEMEV